MAFITANFYGHKKQIVLVSADLRAWAAHSQTRPRAETAWNSKRNSRKIADWARVDHQITIKRKKITGKGLNKIALSHSLTSWSKSGVTCCNLMQWYQCSKCTKGKRASSLKASSNPKACPLAHGLLCILPSQSKVILILFKLAKLVFL